MTKTWQFKQIQFFFFFFATMILQYVVWDTDQNNFTSSTHEPLGHFLKLE